jgi:hypothetical protein
MGQMSLSDGAAARSVVWGCASFLSLQQPPSFFASPLQHEAAAFFSLLQQLPSFFAVLLQHESPSFFAGALLAVRTLAASFTYFSGFFLNSARQF